MRKIRINDLARELEVKSKAILDVLPKVGIIEKKTHSSSIEEDEARRVQKYFAEHATKLIRGSRSPAAGADEFKPKIDLSRISKPGDVRAFQQRTKAAPGLSPQSALSGVRPQPGRPIPGQPIYPRTTSTASRLKPTPNPVKLEGSAAAKPEQKTAHKDDIQQAEEALQMLRKQDKQSGRRTIES
jgi:translation initiation factor IF-2